MAVRSSSESGRTRWDLFAEAMQSWASTVRLAILLILYSTPPCGAGYLVVRVIEAYLHRQLWLLLSRRDFAFGGGPSCSACGLPRHQPVPQGGRVGPDPDQPHGPAAEFGGPAGPPLGIVDLLGERRGQQHRAAVRTDLPGGGRHPRVLVHLDVLVVPPALALTGGPPGRGQRGRDERPVHGVLVQQGRGRRQPGQQPPRHRALPGSGRPGHHPGRSAGIHAPEDRDPGPPLGGTGGTAIVSRAVAVVG